MKDKEIIKALECCNKSDNGKGCFECPYRQYCPDCLRRRNEDTIDLINRQKAEIERLTAHLEELADEVEDKMTYMCGCKNCIETVKRIIKDDVKPFDMYCDSCNRCKHREAEAVKEFAERLKFEKATGMNWFGKEHYSVKVEEIDKLVKEMVGENK